MVGVGYDLVRRIGSNIKSVRMHAGVSLEQLASAMDVPVDLLLGIERGDEDACGQFDILTFLRAARKLQVTPDRLIGE